MVGELGAGIEGETATHRGGQWTEEFSKFFHYRFSRLARFPFLLVNLFLGRRLMLEAADDGALTAIPEALDICESRPTQPFQLFSYRGCHAIEIQEAAARLH